jgi:hypothetical protein
LRWRQATGQRRRAGQGRDPFYLSAMGRRATAAISSLLFWCWFFFWFTCRSTKRRSEPQRKIGRGRREEEPEEIALRPHPQPHPQQPARLLTCRCLHEKEHGRARIGSSLFLCPGGHLPPRHWTPP